jgi:hypothetical protein
MKDQILKGKKKYLKKEKKSTFLTERAAEEISQTFNNKFCSCLIFESISHLH